MKPTKRDEVRKMIKDVLLSLIEDYEVKVKKENGLTYRVYHVVSSLDAIMELMDERVRELEELYSDVCSEIEDIRVKELGDRMKSENKIAYLQRQLAEIKKRFCHVWIYDNPHGIFGTGTRTCNVCGIQEKHEAVKFK